MAHKNLTNSLLTHKSRTALVQFYKLTNLENNMDDLRWDWHRTSNWYIQICYNYYDVVDYCDGLLENLVECQKISRIGNEITN